MFSLVDITFQMVIIVICPVNVQLKTPGPQIYRPLSQSFYNSRVTQSARERLNDQSWWVIFAKVPRIKLVE